MDNYGVHILMRTDKVRAVEDILAVRKDHAEHWFARFHFTSSVGVDCLDRKRG